jgi:hypothetical protein
MDFSLFLFIENWLEFFVHAGVQLQHPHACPDNASPRGLSNKAHSFRSVFVSLVEQLFQEDKVHRNTQTLTGS